MLLLKRMYITETPQTNNNKMKIKPRHRIVIQDEISVDQAFVDDIIKRYQNMPDNFNIGINEKSWDKKGLINEIKSLTETGKMIILMDYRFYNSDFYKKNKEEIDKLRTKDEEKK